MAGRPFLILRPYPIDHEIDMPFYYDAVYIDTYDKFKRAIKAELGDSAYPIDKELIEKYYSIEEKPAYIRVADVIEGARKRLWRRNVLDDAMFEVHRWMYLIKKGIFIKYAIKALYQFLYINFNIRYTGRLRNVYAFSEWESDASHGKDKINEKKYEMLERIVRKG